MKIPHRALGIVREIVTELRHDITYAYEDLVFIDHNAYLLQFTDSPDMVHLYFNIEFPEEDAEVMTRNLVESAEKRNIGVIRKGHYELAQTTDDTIEVKFYNRKEGID
ncbi:hypothetical protein [Prosthecochloris sp.]|uniref:hypothetical protein n=1 Tax=Prosthecochloris sp. TaxID=290513 RepID=UPI00257C81AD|nr:hypothetical protein [Prosthecochloris sp.]